MGVSSVGCWQAHCTSEGSISWEDRSQIRTFWKHELSRQEKCSLLLSSCWWLVDQRSPRGQRDDDDEAGGGFDKHDRKVGLRNGWGWGWKFCRKFTCICSGRTFGGNISVNAWSSNHYTRHHNQNYNNSKNNANNNHYNHLPHHHHHNNNHDRTNNDNNTKAKNTTKYKLRCWCLSQQRLPKHSQV